MSKFDDLADTWVFEPMSKIFVLLMAALLFIGIPWALYSWITYEPPVTFSLRVDSWECTKSHTREVEVCTKGCRWTTETVCDQWSRK